MISFFVEGRPATKGSWRPIRRKDGRVFLKPDNEREMPWAQAVAWAARAAGARPLDEPMVACVEFFFARPHRPTNPFPRGDVDKLARSCLDALTGICWSDDSRVVKLLAVKRWTGEDRDREGAQFRVYTARECEIDTEPMLTAGADYRASSGRCGAIPEAG